MTLNVTQGHLKWRDSIGHISYFFLVVCGNNVSMLHHFRDITTFSFDTTVEITSHIRFRFISEHIVDNMQNILPRDAMLARYMP